MTGQTAAAMLAVDQSGGGKYGDAAGQNREGGRQAETDQGGTAKSRGAEKGGGGDTAQGVGRGGCARETGGRNPETEFTAMMDAALTREDRRLFGLAVPDEPKAPAEKAG